MDKDIEQKMDKRCIDARCWKTETRFKNFCVNSVGGVVENGGVVLVVGKSLF